MSYCRITGRPLTRCDYRTVTKKLPIYEAALSYDGVLVFVDILVPDGEGWHLIEVKSSTKVKDYHKPDASIQTWVARQMGVVILKTSIGCINNQFVYSGGEDYEGLFYLTDITSDSENLIPSVTNWVSEARNTLSGKEPKLEMGDQCTSPFSCPFMDYCQPAKEQLPIYPVTDLPNSKKIVTELLAEGFQDLKAVPEERLTNVVHKRIREAVVTEKPYISSDVAKLIGDIDYPRYHLDFETIAFTVPQWVGTRPYQAIPFQWSCHIEHTSGSITHREFLAEAGEDPRRKCAQSLFELFSEKGPVIAYNAGFERGRILELADLFPEYAQKLKEVATWIVDLLSITKAHYYHPDMHGSWSIKYVLPTIAPELSYDGMHVADGNMAQDTFSKLMSDDLSEEEIINEREALLRYCERDTLAMVKITHFFANSAGSLPDKE